MAPAPVFSPKMPEECARRPAVSTFQPEAPRRAIVALLNPVAFSKPKAISLSLAASIKAFLEIERGFPVRSSSPVNPTVIVLLSRRFKSCRAFKAYKITTFPPFISLAPGPKAMLSCLTKR